MISRRLTRLGAMHPGILFFTDREKGLPGPLIFSISEILGMIESVGVFGLFLRVFVISSRLRKFKVIPDDIRVPGNCVSVITIYCLHCVQYY